MPAVYVFAWMAAVFGLAVWSQVGFGRYVRVYRELVDSSVPEFGRMGPSVWFLIRHVDLAERLNDSLGIPHPNPTVESARRTLRQRRRMLRMVGVGGIIGVLLLRMFGG